MALNPDEQELVDSVTEAVEDFYPPLLALMFYRYNRQSAGLPHFLPTEEFRFLAIHSFNDLNEYYGDKQRIDDAETVKRDTIGKSEG